MARISVTILLLLTLIFTWSHVTSAKRSSKSIAATPDFDLRCPFTNKAKGIRVCNLAVVEAGSKSTRLHIAEFFFQPAAKNANGKKAATPRSMRGELRDFRLKSYHSHKPKEDPATKDKGPHELSVDVFRMQIAQLIDENMKDVAVRRLTTVVFKGTSMFRRMTKPEWQLRAQAVADVLKDKGLAPLRKHPEPEQIGVISGRDESVLVWMAANYLLGSSGLESQRSTATVLDMGWGSVEVAQRGETTPTKKGKRSSSKKKSNSSQQQTAYNRLTSEVYAKSYASLSDSRLGIAQLTAQSQQQSPAPGTPGSKTELQSHCMPPSMETAIPANDKFAIRSADQPSFDACMNAASKYVTQKLGVKPLPIKSPPKVFLCSQFYIIGQHAREVVAQATGQKPEKFPLRVGDFLTGAREACRKPLEKGAKTGGWKCVDQIFTYYFLLSMGFGDEREVVIAEELQASGSTTKVKVSWAFGEMLRTLLMANIQL